MLWSAAKALRQAWRVLRFRLWAARLRLQLLRFGARLELDVPWSISFDSLPQVNLLAEGDGDATLTLRAGERAHLGRNMTLEVWARGTNLLELGHDTRFLGACRVQLRSGTVRLGDNTLVRDTTVFKSSGELAVGSNVLISHFCVVHCTERIVLEDLVTLAERVSVVDSDHDVDGSDEHNMVQPLAVSPVQIERNALVSAGSVVLRGSRVGRNALIAAGSVLTGGVYPAAWISAGAPAEPVKPLPRAEAERSAHARSA